MRTKPSKKIPFYLLIIAVLFLTTLINEQWVYSQEPSSVETKPLPKTLNNSKALASAQQAQVPVTIKVSQENLSNGKVRYYYRLVNHSTHAIVIMTIGHDYFHGESELLVMPIGWDAQNDLPKGSTTSPKGWYATVITPEESNYHELQWEIEFPTAALAPEQTLASFSVVLPQIDDHYRTTHGLLFSVTLLLSQHF